jgi:crossover junction endodeoxyribonuclease RuvC
VAGGVILGIDPGVTGALAFLRPSNRVETFPMPVFKAKHGHELDEAALSRMLDARSRDIEFALLERQWARPTDGGPQAFKLGCNFGALRMLLASNFIPYRMVTPQAWKRAMGLLNEGKDASRAAATKAFPQDAEQWRLKRAEGRAEAALLASWGRTHPVVAEAA